MKLLKCNKGFTVMEVVITTVIIGIMFIIFFGGNDHSIYTEKIKSDTGDTYEIVCIGGIQYLNGTNTLTPFLKSDGSARLCEEQEIRTNVEEDEFDTEF